MSFLTFCCLCLYQAYSLKRLNPFLPQSKRRTGYGLDTRQPETIIQGSILKYLVHCDIVFQIKMSITKPHDKKNFVEDDSRVVKICLYTRLKTSDSINRIAELNLQPSITNKHPSISKYIEEIHFFTNMAFTSWSKVENIYIAFVAKPRMKYTYLLLYE